MAGMKEKLKRFFKDTKTKVAASVIGGVLAIVLIIIIIWLFFPAKHAKTSTGAKSQKGLSEPALGGVNNLTRKRKIHGVITKGAEEVDDSKNVVVDGAAERKNQVHSSSEADLVRRKPDPGANPPLIVGETDESTLGQKKQKADDSTQQPPPEPRNQTPPIDLKAEFEADVAKFNRDVDASEIPLLNVKLKNMLEESKEPQQTLSEYLKKNYETKRDAALGAKVAGEKDVNDLKLLLKGLRIVEPLYPDEMLEIQFAEKFVTPFLEAFRKLESKIVVPEDADLALEAKNAFPLARMFANLVPQNVSKEVRDKYSHDSFKWKSLIAYLEQLIPKLIEEAKDVAAEATALNYIRILRLLNPKSRYAYEGKDSIEEIKQSMHRPSIISYFVLDVPQRLPLLTVDSVKNMSKVELEELEKQISVERELCRDQNRDVDLAICGANLALVDVFLFERVDRNNEIFAAWMNTGFKTTRCPEFLNWIEHDLALNGHSVLCSDRASAMPGDLHFLDFVRWMHEKRARAFSYFDSKTYVEEYVQQMAIPLAYEGFNLSLPGSEARKKLVKFLQTESPEDTKIFFSSLSEWSEWFNNQLERDCLRIHNVLKHLDLCFESSMAYEMLHYLQELQKFEEINAKSDFGAKLESLEESTDLNVAYQWWTECKDNKKEPCWKVFRSVATQHLLEKKIKTLELEYEASKVSGTRAEVPVNSTEGKHGLIMALRAYIAVRFYFDNAEFKRLERDVLSHFEFTKLPTDCSSLNISTYKKNYNSHSNLMEYIQLSSYRKEWTSFAAILRSMDGNSKIVKTAVEKRSAILLLKRILKECAKKEKCKTDQTRNIFICTSEDLYLELDGFSNLKGELETYFLEILEEAMQSDDLTKQIKKLDTELDLIACNLELTIWDDWKITNSTGSAGTWMNYFNWADGRFIESII